MAKNNAGQAVTAALENLDRSAQAVIDAIQADPDPRRAYQEATELVETMQSLLEASGDLRAKSAARIVKDEGLSLAGLAERISVSKARAAQLINTAKKANTEPTTPKESQ
jgi:hypothetical protein